MISLLEWKAKRFASVGLRRFTEVYEYNSRSEREVEVRGGEWSEDNCVKDEKSITLHLSIQIRWSKVARCGSGVG